MMSLIIFRLRCKVVYMNDVVVVVGGGGDGKKISKLDKKIEKPPCPLFASQPLNLNPPPSQNLPLRDLLYIQKPIAKRLVNLSLSSITYK